MRKLTIGLVLLVCMNSSVLGALLYDSNSPNASNPVSNGGPYDGIIQNSGNAYRGLGGQVTLDLAASSGGITLSGSRITSIVVPTATFGASGTPIYAPEYLELRLYYNDGAIDDSNSDLFVEGDPTGSHAPGTLIATSRVARADMPDYAAKYAPTGSVAPTYPLNGNHRKNPPTTVVTFLFNSTYQGQDALGTLILANKSFGPTASTNGEGAGNQSLNSGVSFTWVIDNLNAAGTTDGADTTANQWSIFQDKTGTEKGETDLTWINYGGPRVSSTPWESMNPSTGGPNDTPSPLNDSTMVFAAEINGTGVYSAASSISFSSTAQNTNVADATNPYGKIGNVVAVDGSFTDDGKYISEIDDLTATVNKGSAIVDDVLNTDDTLVMLWLIDNTPGDGIDDIGNLITALDASAAGKYDIARSNAGISDPLYADIQELLLHYPGFTALARFESSVVGFNNTSFNWDFAAHPNVLTDRIAVVPEPAGLCIALSVIPLLRRRKRRNLRPCFQ